MPAWQTQRDKLSWNLPFLFLLGLFFYIPGACSGFGLTNLQTETLIGLSSMGLFLLPLAMFLISPVHRRYSGLGRQLTVLGLWLWFIGSTISTMVYSQEAPGALLQYISGIFAAMAVFYAIRAITKLTIPVYQALIAAMVLGGLVPAISGVIAYYRVWDIPTLDVLLLSRYNVQRMEPYAAATFDGTGGAGCFFVLLAGPCIAVLMCKVFRRWSRWLCGLGILFSVLNLLIDQSRTCFMALAATWLVTAIYVRMKKSVVVVTALIILAITAIPEDIQNKFSKGMTLAMTYDATDSSVAERRQSIEVGWQDFLDHPLLGYGLGQSYLYNPGFVAHSLPISQGDEVGFLGFAGVILVTISCVARLIALLWKGVQHGLQDLRFVLLLGPTVYFVSGLGSAVFVNHTFHNSWICGVFALLGLADLAQSEQINGRGMAVQPLPRPGRMLLPVNQGSY